MTGSMPGMAASTRLTLALGSAPKAVEAPEKSLASDVTWAWISIPTTTSQSPVAPGMSAFLSGLRVSMMFMAALRSESGALLEPFTPNWKRFDGAAPVAGPCGGKGTPARRRFQLQHERLQGVGRAIGRRGVARGDRAGCADPPRRKVLPPRAVAASRHRPACPAVAI